MLAACSHQQIDTSNRIQIVTDVGVSDEVKNFTSPDLALNDLHSKVAYVVIKSYNVKDSDSTAQENASPEIVVYSTDTIQFDPSGRMIRRVSSYGDSDKDMVEMYIYSPEGELTKAYAVRRDRVDEYKLRVTRDANNYIIKINHIYVHDGPLDDSKDYEEVYNWENGLLKSIGSSHQISNEYKRYEHDERGLVSECIQAYRNDYDTFTKFSDTYEYIEFDKCNNWVRCKVHCDNHVNMFGGMEKWSSKSYYFIERQIMYIK
jgi:hypothetical protein